MKHSKITLSLLVAMALTACEEKIPQLGTSSLDKVIAAMTTEEKVRLLVGTGMAGFSGESAVVGMTEQKVPGAAGTTYAIPRLGIPAVVLADGPAGLRITPVRKGDDNTYYATAFPVATTLASSWNTNLIEQVGTAMGNEVLEYGVDVLLAPGMNIHRNPLCGRNFEYYSEDPLLTGKMAAAFTRGVQSNGVGVSVKHFAANNQETNRLGNDSRVTPRALREIYLKGFEIAVKESAPWTIMSSYNKINGTYTAESKDLLTTILRNEWGYDGMVMTDWFGGKDAPAMVIAGNDLLMPGEPKQYEDIIAAINEGRISEDDLNRNVKNILNLILKSPVFKGYEYSNKPDLKSHALVTRESAAEGMVLLKNENYTLPLGDKAKNIALFGIASYDFEIGGTGSGDVNEAYSVSLAEGLVNVGYNVNEELKSEYEAYISAEYEKQKPDPSTMFFPKTRPSEKLPASVTIAREAREADVAVVTIGRTSGEFADRRLEGDFYLTDDEKKLIEVVSKAFRAAGKRTVVVLNIGGVVETASWKDLPDAILVAWQPGQEGGNSVADILKGVVSPSGKLPMTFPIDYMDIPSSINFPWDPEVVKVVGNSFMEGRNDDGNPVRNVDYTVYEEDIYVGYRYSDTFHQPVSYPFGYGLSYTSFEYGAPVVKDTGDTVEVTVQVSNNGEFSGKEVVQVYVSAPQSNLHKPAKELKAFSKTAQLKPGEAETLTFKIVKKDLASFDSSRNIWIAEAGDYLIHIAASSQDIKHTAQLSLKEAVVEKTEVALLPENTIQLLKP